METQNYTCCKRKRNVSCLSIGKAGVYSKEQDKKILQ